MSMSGSRKALVAVGLAAVMAVAYLGLAVWLAGDSAHATRHVVSGQMLIVQLRGSWDWLRSSDDAVVRPLSVSLKPNATGYFVAAKPGKAFVQALNDPCPTTMAPPRCMAPAMIFAVEVEVWPG